MIVCGFIRFGRRAEKSTGGETEGCEEGEKEEERGVDPNVSPFEVLFGCRDLCSVARVIQFDFGQGISGLYPFYV